MPNPKTVTQKLLGAALGIAAIVGGVLLAGHDATASGLLVASGAGLLGWVGLRRPGDAPAR